MRLRGLVRVGQRHARGARGHLAQVGEQGLAEGAVLGAALGLGQVAAQPLELARHAPAVLAQRAHALREVVAVLGLRLGTVHDGRS